MHPRVVVNAFFLPGSISDFLKIHERLDVAARTKSLLVVGIVTGGPVAALLSRLLWSMLNATVWKWRVIGVQEWCLGVFVSGDMFAGDTGGNIGLHYTCLKA